MAPNPVNTKRIDEAQKLAKTDPAQAENLYKEILSKGPGSGEVALREYETALMGLGELYRDEKKANELAELVRTSRSTLSSFAKAKTAKLGEHIDRMANPTTNSEQCDNSSTFSPLYQTQSPSRYRSQSHV